MKKHLFFAITELYKGGAEVALVNLLKSLDKSQYRVDLLIMKQAYAEQSLLSQIPSWVRVCDAGAKNKKRTDNLWQEKYRCGGNVARRFVFGRNYDIAISYGEWCYHDFVDKAVKARKKAMWIHTDITQLQEDEQTRIHQYALHYDTLIFVAKGILSCAVEKYPDIYEKSVVIHNIIDSKNILNRSLEPVSDFSFTKKYRLITVAHIRSEKGYFRMIETAQLLKNKGLDIEWLCLGRIALPEYYRALQDKLASYNLLNTFVFLGERANPYPYIKMADVFVLLSDYEAMPLSISEAMMIGKPVIATATSGAMELIVDGENGYICSFEPVDIAEKVELLLTNSQVTISSDPFVYDNQFCPTEEWEQFVCQDKN